MMGPGISELVALTFLIGIFLIGVLTTALWLVIGWRAMRAHEKMADYVELMIRQQISQRETQSNVSTDD